MALSMNLGAEDKKKLYLLGGLLGVLGVVGTIFVIMPMLGGGSSDDTSTSSTSNSATIGRSPSGQGPFAGATPPSGGGSFGTTTPVSTTTSTSTAVSGSPTDPVLSPQLIGVGQARRDPFSPEEVVPIKIETPRYQTQVTTETLAPAILPPYQPATVATTISLPTGVGTVAPSSAGGTGITDSRILFSLPPATIFGTTARTAPRQLPVFGGLEVAAPGSQVGVVSADDKRVAGVIIGDSIRALIEYQENGQTVSRVVQPGDTVAGMEILSIGRVSEGGEQIVRVTVRENGQEKFFDLRSR